ncbi:imidazole glycerol phosphate synthase subunit HisH [Bacillus sp. RG28]|uniref:Imidazole glycerol phosphate synthase subunit HisH n=1 Tax=Gottfriedia endophytica TaxID=2820819 RepID=A0A940NRL3_9BACI|nr:imidazole glycerol phosphate synthase subunit HisH [Gottfriedia endophytica]MBP0725722.1 imidazole glycerol phosphate synthase subunit HisH [Gottfriedia endophytica]
MNIIVDYGAGNLSSLQRAFEQIGLDVEISDDKEVIQNASSIILPGVGAFGAAMDELKKRNLIDVLKKKAMEGTPFLGICLGMQLLYEFSEEEGKYEGLGLLKGTIKRIPDTVKVPHMGWNSLTFYKNDPILKNNLDGDYVYFVHSYYAQADDENIVAYSDYGVKVPAIVNSKNIYGMQFHPEKSSEAGLNLLKTFKEMISYETISSN